jgi:hypothetical protein
MGSVRFTGGDSVGTTVIPSSAGDRTIFGWHKPNAGEYGGGSETCLVGGGTTGGSSQGLLLNCGFAGNTTIAALAFHSGGGVIQSVTFRTGSATDWFAFFWRLPVGSTDVEFGWRLENQTTWTKTTLPMGAVLTLSGGSFHVGTNQFGEVSPDSCSAGCYIEEALLSDAQLLTATQALHATRAAALHSLAMSSAATAHVNGGTGGDWTPVGTLTDDASEPVEVVPPTPVYLPFDPLPQPMSAGFPGFPGRMPAPPPILFGTGIFARGAAPALVTQSFSVAIGVALSTTKQLQLQRSAPVSVTLSFARLVGMVRSLAVTAAPATVKQVAGARPVSIAVTPSTLKQPQLVRASPVAVALSTVKQVLLARAIGALVTISVAQSSSSLKVALRTYAVAITVTAVVVWQVGLVRAVGVAVTLATVKAVQLTRSTTATITATADALKVALRDYSIAITTTLGVGKQVLLTRGVALAIAVNPVALVQRIFAVAVAVSVARVVQVRRIFARAIAVALDVSADASVAFTFAVGVLVTPSVTKRVELTRAAPIAVQPSTLKQVAITLALPITVTASVARRFFRSFSVLVSALVAIVSDVLPYAGPATGTWVTLDIQTQRVILRVGMTKSFVGQRHRLHASFYTFGDSRLSDPDEVTFTINGVDFPGVRDGVGVYHYDYIPAEAGRYQVSVVGTGHVAAVGEASFEARALS